MKKILLFLTIFITSLSALAECPAPQERAQWMREMQKYKNEYLANYIGLKEQSRAKFYDIYTSMDREIKSLYDKARDFEEQVEKKGEKATDLECTKAADEAFSIKGKENNIEQKYYSQLKALLTPKQLFKLKGGERQFTRELMKYHRKSKGKKKD